MTAYYQFRLWLTGIKLNPTGKGSVKKILRH